MRLHSVFVADNHNSLIPCQSDARRQRQCDCPPRCMTAKLNGKLARVLLMAIGVSTLAVGDDGGSVRGNVGMIGEDGARSFVPNASVVLHSNTITMQTTADNQGFYTFVSVPPGSYELEAQAPGVVGTASVQVQAATTENVSI